MASIHNRLLEIIENENLPIAAFERRIYVGRNSISTAIRNKSAIRHQVLFNISKKFPKYSLDWIVCGKSSPHDAIVNLAIKIKRVLHNWEKSNKKTPFKSCSEN